MARKPNKLIMKPRRRGPGVAQLEQMRISQLNHPFQQAQVGVPFMVHTTTGTAVSGPFWSNPFVFGAPDYTRLLPVGSYSETSVELSSMPKLIHHYECPPFDAFCQGAEVVTVHRKMEAKGRKVFMEYEFFPEKDKEEEMAASQSSEASSCLTPSTPSSLDLSLKLSL